MINGLIALLLLVLLVWQRQVCLKALVHLWLYWVKRYQLIAVNLPKFHKDQTQWVLTDQPSLLLAVLLRVWSRRSIYCLSPHLTIPRWCHWLGIRSLRPSEDILRGSMVLAHHDVDLTSVDIQHQFYGYLCGESKQFDVGHRKRYALSLSVVSRDNTQGWPAFVIAAWKKHIHALPPIVSQWLQAYRRLSRRFAIVDHTGQSLGRSELIAGVWIMRDHLAQQVSGQHYIGVCLPPSKAGVMTLLALWSLGKVVVPLNYTASSEQIRHAMDQANVQTVITSAQFLQQLDKKGFSFSDAVVGRQVFELESMKAVVTTRQRAMRFMQALCLPQWYLQSRLSPTISPQEVAVVLFSSGSEGMPKGIVLTHENLIANCLQAAQAFAPSLDDIMLGTLPLFHAFGLTISTVLPVIMGIPLVTAPDPRDGKLIAELIQRHQVTFMCVTSSLLRLYAKSSQTQGHQLASIRMVIAGGEKLQTGVREAFEEKFHQPIFEGYGATELSPVVAVNRPDTLYKTQHRVGTVGLPLSGCFAKVVDPESGEHLPAGQRGMLLVTGINLMRGYLQQPKKTRQSVIEADGVRWYRTGDCASLDTDGFITLHDRYARFAKIGAEMISLAMVEDAIRAHLNEEIELLVVSIPDERKGELLCVLFENSLTKTVIKQAISDSILPNLARPKHLFPIEQMPKLGSGKMDFSGAKQWVLEQF